MEHPSSTKPNDNNGRQKSSTFAIAVAGTVVLGTFGLMAPFVSGLRHKIFLPYMATPKGKLRTALQHAVDTSSSLSKPGLSTQPLRFLDLGSGDGEAVYQAVKLATPSLQLDEAVGIEINPTLFALASLRRFTWTNDQRRRSRFLCGSFWDHSLSPYSIVMIFGVPPLMKDLSDKIHRECVPGTVVLSYRFPLPLDTGVNGRASIVRHEDEMFTYVLASRSTSKDETIKVESDQQVK